MKISTKIIYLIIVIGLSFSLYSCESVTVATSDCPETKNDPLGGYMSALHPYIRIGSTSDSTWFYCVSGDAPYIIEIYDIDTKLKINEINLVELNYGFIYTDLFVSSYNSHKIVLSADYLLPHLPYSGFSILDIDKMEINLIQPHYYRDSTIKQRGRLYGYSSESSENNDIFYVWKTEDGQVDRYYYQKEKFEKIDIPNLQGFYDRPPKEMQTTPHFYNSNKNDFVFTPIRYYMSGHPVLPKPFDNTNVDFSIREAAWSPDDTYFAIGISVNEKQKSFQLWIYDVNKIMKDSKNSLIKVINLRDSFCKYATGYGLNFRFVKYNKIWATLNDWDGPTNLYEIDIDKLTIEQITNNPK